MSLVDMWVDGILSTQDLDEHFSDPEWIREHIEQGPALALIDHYCGWWEARSLQVCACQEIHGPMYAHVGQCEY